MRQPTHGQKLYPVYDPWHEGEVRDRTASEDWLTACSSNEPIGCLTMFGNPHTQAAMTYSPGESLEEYRARQRRNGNGAA